MEDFNNQNEKTQALEALRNEREELEKLRAEIWEFKTNEKDTHLKGIDPDVLTDEDLRIYRKFKNQELAEDELNNYQLEAASKAGSSKEFSAMIGNWQQVKLMRKEMKALKKAEGQK